jgi:hypothetical protein
MKRYTLIERESCEERYIRARDLAHALEKAERWALEGGGGDIVEVAVFAGGPRNTPHLHQQATITVRRESMKPCEFCVGGEAVHGRLALVALDGIIITETSFSGYDNAPRMLVIESCATCCKYTNDEAFDKIVSILRNHKED